MDYLGFGHLYTGTLFTSIFGGDFHASLIAFSFLTMISLAAISIMVGWAVFKKITVALAFTNIILIIVIVQPLFYTHALSGTEEILKALNSGLNPGNSARVIRGLILPLLAVAFGMGTVAFEKLERKYIHLKNKRNFINLCGVGFLAGGGSYGAMIMV